MNDKILSVLMVKQWRLFGYETLKSQAKIVVLVDIMLMWEYLFIVTD